jgi:hypothetical protein
MNNEPIPVKVSVLKVIHTALFPIKIRLDALLEDVYAKNLALSQAELTALLEFRSASATAELMLNDYLEQAEEHEVEKLFLPAAEFNLLFDLSKTAELSTRTPIANSGLWRH